MPYNNTTNVANTLSDAVSIINLENMQIEGHFAAGRKPDGVNFPPLRPEPQHARCLHGGYQVRMP